MNAVIVLLALSALIGFALGASFSWVAIMISSAVIAATSVAALSVQDFGALSGIATIVACLSINQMAYLAGAARRSNGLFQKQADKEPSQRRDSDIAGKHHKEQKYPSRFLLNGGRLTTRQFAHCVRFQHSRPCPDSLHVALLLFGSAGRHAGTSRPIDEASTFGQGPLPICLIGSLQNHLI
jgi:hypothetical protein